MAEYIVHGLPVDGVCPRCGKGEWDTDERPLTERETAFAPNITCGAA